MSSVSLDCGSTPSAKNPMMFAASEGFPPVVPWGADPGDSDAPGAAGDADDDADAPGDAEAPGDADVPDELVVDPPLHATSAAAITTTINNAITFFILLSF